MSRAPESDIKTKAQETIASLPANATDFVVRYPTVELVHGDFTNGYGVVRVPTTAP